MERVLKENINRDSTGSRRPVQGKSEGDSAQDSLFARINGSPRMVAQCRALCHLFGNAIQRQSARSAAPLQGKRDPTPALHMAVGSQSGSETLPIQRAVITNGGEFDTPMYSAHHAGMPAEMASVGADIELRFKPNAMTKPKKIGLVQSVRSQRTEQTKEEQYEDDPSKLGRMTEQGTHIDQSTFVDTTGNVMTEDEAGKKPGSALPQTNPVYNATNRPDSLATSLSENTETNQFGSIHNGEVDDEHPAVLKDHPGRILMPGEHLIHQFETTALELEGDKRYLGSVSWGYEASNDESGTLHNAVLTPEPIAKVSDGVPSAEFLGAATLWNQQPVPGVGDQGETARVPLPIQ